MVHEFVQIVPHERFSSGKNQNGRSEVSQSIDQFQPLIRGELVLAFDAVGAGIAVLAIEIAASRYVPDNNGFFIDRELKEMGRKGGRFSSVPQDVGWFYGSAVELRYADHPLFLFMRFSIHNEWVNGLGDGA
jgi:hypothetical protein